MIDEKEIEILSIMKEPMHLFKPEKNYKLELVSQTLEELAKIKSPIVIISIIGTQRGGKSTLLNLLHSRKTSGFGLGHYMDPQTTGLWLWARSHPRDSELKVVLMDTEGLDSPHVPQWYNWTLAALALMISSYFIYQTKGSIDSNAIDRLGVILKVAEQLGGTSDNKETDKPNFLWLIRDHQLAMKKNPKLEMLDKLDSNSLKSLQKFFSDYDCYPLPRPVDKDELLKEVENLSWDQLKSDFREEYIIYNSIQHPRKLSGQIITGEMIANLIEKYSKAINQKDGILTELSQLPTQRQMIIRISGERALKQSLLQYNKYMNENVLNNLPMSQENLSIEHNKAYEIALSTFKKELMIENEENFDSDIKDYFNEFNEKIANWVPLTTIIGNDCISLKKLISGFFFDIFSKNIQKSKEECQNVLDNLYSPIIEKLYHNIDYYNNINQYYKDLEYIKNQYEKNEKARGVAKEEILNEFLKNRQNDINTIQLSILKKEIMENFKQSNLDIQHLHELINQQNIKIEEKFIKNEKKIDSTVDKINSEIKDLSHSFQSQVMISNQMNLKVDQFNEELKTINSTLDQKIDKNYHSISNQLAMKEKKINSEIEKIQSENTFIKQMIDEKIQNIEIKLDFLENDVNQKLENFYNNSIKNDEEITLKLENIKIFYNEILEKYSNQINQLKEGLTLLKESINDQFKIQKQFTEEIEHKFEEKLQKQTKDGNDQILLSSKKLEEHIYSLHKEMEENQKNINQTIQFISSEWNNKQENNFNNFQKKIDQIQNENLNKNQHYDEKISELKSELETNIKYLNNQINQSILKELENLAINLTLYQQKQENISNKIEKEIMIKLEKDIEYQEKINNLSLFVEKFKNDMNNQVIIEKNIEEFKENMIVINNKLLQLDKNSNEYNQYFKKIIENFNENIQTIQKEISSIKNSLVEKIQDMKIQLEKQKENLSLKEFVSSMEHIKQSVDAIWSSIGVLSGRIVDVEATIDRIIK